MKGTIALHPTLTDEDMCGVGIYAIVNERNGKFYVGSTGRSFKKRLRDHQSALNLQNHGSSYFQRAWNKQDGEGFVFLVLESIPQQEFSSVSYLLSVEQMWLDATACLHSRYGYNHCPTAGSPLGIKRTAEAKMKMSILRSKKYIATDPQGKEIRVTNLPSFCKKHGLSEYHMRDCARGISKAHKGWMCRFADGSTPEWEDKTDKCKKDYIVTDPDGKVYYVKGLNEFCKKHGLLQANMSEVARGNVSNHKGWRCEFADGSTPEYVNQVSLRRKEYVVTDPQGNEYKVDYLREFCDLNGLGRSGMLGLQKVARGKAPAYKGWKCRLADGSSPEFQPKGDTVSKSYMVTDPNGKRFEVRNLAKFCKENGLSDSGMNTVARGLNHHYKGWKCEHADGSSPECEKEPRSKEWILTDPDGKEYRITNLNQFCRDHGISIKGLSNVAYGKARKYKGWKCRRVDLPDPVFKSKPRPPMKHWIAIAPDGTEYKTDNMNGFCREHGLIMAGMSNVARGKVSQHKGWKCRYDE